MFQNPVSCAVSPFVCALTVAGKPDSRPVSGTLSIICLEHLLQTLIRRLHLAARRAWEPHLQCLLSSNSEQSLAPCSHEPNQVIARDPKFWTRSCHSPLSSLCPTPSLDCLSVGSSNSARPNVCREASSVEDEAECDGLQKRIQLLHAQVMRTKEECTRMLQANSEKAPSFPPPPAEGPKKQIRKLSGCFCFVVSCF